MKLDELRSTLNKWGQEKVPFLFMVDFEMKKPLTIKLIDVQMEEILFYLNGFTNSNDQKEKGTIELKKFPIPLEEYSHSFNEVMNHLAYGDSFLTNLTIKTEIKINRSLKELFYQSHAKYKLWLKDQFLVFSPEIFVQIRDAKIFSYPMKGTIDASIPNAEAIILADQKELSEHVTIVDLIRNDLSLVSSDVKVTRFRYVDAINTTSKKLLQVSSEIVGELAEDYLSRIGDIIVALLPAGSVSGAPKEKTLEIIKQAEGENRGYYTGVFGYFNGTNLDSGVMIRFIEQNEEKYYYRSGGGITTQSILEAEYQEAIDKIYVQVD